MNAARLLVSACDTGSGNLLSPVLARLERDFALCAQKHAAKIFDRWGIAYQAVDPLGWDDLLTVGTRILSQSGAKLVITGTSWGPTIDKALTLAAREMRIPCVAIIEHWDLYLERFSVVTNGQIVDRGRYLPDRIWVNDQTAQMEAVAAGLPADRVEAIGQPHLEWQLETLRARGACTRDDRIVFVSEQVAQDFAPESPLYRGFDEFKTLEALLSATEHSDRPILVKLHPQEHADKYDRIRGRSGRVQVVKDADNADLIRSCGRIVGMFSMLLLEAALVRDDVISFMPGGDPAVFIGNRLGATTCVTTKDALTKLLAKADQDADQVQTTISAFGQRFLGSTTRMCDSIRKLLV